MDLNRIVTDVKMSAGRITPAEIKLRLHRVAFDFCDRTGIWRVKLTATPSPSTEYPYRFTLGLNGVPDGAVVNRMVGREMNGVVWDIPGSKFESPDKVDIPGGGSVPVTVLCELAPSPDINSGLAAVAAAEWASRFQQGLVSGLLMALASDPFSPAFSPQLFDKHAMDYNGSLAAATAELHTNRVRGTVSARSGRTWL